MPKRPPKTLKEKKFAKIYAETLNATEAAAQTYNVSNRDSARAIGHENLAKLSFESYLDKVGLNDDQIAQNIKEATEATKVISATIIAGSPKDANSQTNDFIEVPDWTNRIKANELALKLKDKFPKNEAGVQYKDGDKTISIIVRNYE
jgi:phage terminase small subunit